MPCIIGTTLILWNKPNPKAKFVGYTVCSIGIICGMALSIIAVVNGFWAFP